MILQHPVPRCLEIWITGQAFPKSAQTFIGPHIHRPVRSYIVSIEFYFIGATAAPNNKLP